MSSGGEAKVAVVTGGAGGMGLAGARRLAAGHSLVLVDVSGERAEAAARELREAGAEAVGLACDVTDAEAIAELLRHPAVAEGVDVLVHTAGVSANMGFGGHQIIDINLRGTARVLDRFVEAIRPQGVAICIASIGGYRPTFWNGYEDLLADPLAADFLTRLDARVSLDDRPRLAYALAKRGVIFLCELLADAWGARGARLVSISPGMITDTPMGELEAKLGAGAIVDIAAIHRGGSAEDVAGAIAFLASDDASYITGCDLRVDGGAIPGFAFHAAAEAKAAWAQPPDEA